MEEMEVPTEHLHEHINEQAEHSKDKWSMYLAVSTAIMAVMAAFGSLLAGHHSNEALISQIKSSDQWAYYQAKGIKEEILVNSDSMFAAIGKPIPAGDGQKRLKYEADKEAIKEKADGMEKSSEEHMNIHVVFSRSVTIYQIAVAISAIAIVTRKKFMWYLSILLAVAGSIFLVLGFFAH